MNFQRVGGRKQFNGYLFALLATVGAYTLGATFETYAMWLSVALLGTSAMVAWEDQRRMVE